MVKSRIINHETIKSLGVITLKSQKNLQLGDKIVISFNNKCEALIAYSVINYLKCLKEDLVEEELLLLYQWIINRRNTN